MTLQAGGGPARAESRVWSGEWEAGAAHCDEREEVVADAAERSQSRAVKGLINILRQRRESRGKWEV